jgi:predicted RNA-binding protein YlqC (UPF0109 family)
MDNKVLQTLEYIIKELVEKPDMVKVSEAFIEDKPTVKVSLVSHDMPRIITRDRRILRALRTMAYAVSHQSDIDITVDIID